MIYIHLQLINAKIMDNWLYGMANKLARLSRPGWTCKGWEMKNRENQLKKIFHIHSLVQVNNKSLSFIHKTTQ